MQNHDTGLSVIEIYVTLVSELWQSKFCEKFWLRLGTRRRAQHDGTRDGTSRRRVPSWHRPQCHQNLWPWSQSHENRSKIMTQASVPSKFLTLVSVSWKSIQNHDMLTRLACSTLQEIESPSFGPTPWRNLNLIISMNAFLLGLVVRRVHEMAIMWASSSQLTKLK